MENPIKWSGSKKCHSKEILSFFPKKINTYYEPFCGSCAIMLELLKSNIKVENIVCSDINRDLIDLWVVIKDNSLNLIQNYEKLYNKFNNKPDEFENIEAWRKFYYSEIRNEFNSINKDVNILLRSSYFLFLLRTCFSGLVRYNSNNEFNSPSHFSRSGMNPYRLGKIIKEVSDLLNKFNVQFYCLSYNDFNSFNEDDFIFLDPPYNNCNNSMYYGNINENDLINYLNSLECDYCLTYNGNRGKEMGDLIEPNNTIKVELEGKNSSFSRINGKKVIVKEIMYVKN